MNIIKQGESKTIIKFECKKCGCIFEADNLEYDVVSQHGFDELWGESFYWTEYHCKCPTCNRLVVSTTR